MEQAGSSGELRLKVLRILPKHRLETLQCFRVPAQIVEAEPENIPRFGILRNDLAQLRIAAGGFLEPFHLELDVASGCADLPEVAAAIFGCVQSLQCVFPIRFQMQGHC